MKKLAYVATLVIAAAIAILTLIPLDFSTPPGGDKLHHLLAFAALSFPISVTHPRTLIWFLPAAILFGGSIEIAQPFVNRSREWADFVADISGLVLGASAGILTHRYINISRTT